MTGDGQLTLTTDELGVASLLHAGESEHETLREPAGRAAREGLVARGLVDGDALAPELARAIRAVFSAALTVSAEVRVGGRVRTLRAWVGSPHAWSAVEEDASIALRELSPAEVAVWLASFLGPVRRRDGWPGGEIDADAGLLADVHALRAARGPDEADRLLARGTGLGPVGRETLMALTAERVTALRLLSVERIDERQAETEALTVINAGAIGLWTCHPPRRENEAMRFCPTSLHEVERRLAGACGGRILDANESRPTGGGDSSSW
jgi:ESAT-6 protein secretion system EspG family protein